MSRHRPSLRLLALLLLPVLAAGTRAEDKWPVPRGDSREPSPFHFDAKKPPTTPKEFLDDAAACILYAGSTYLVEADGTIETIVHDVTRLNGRKGIEKLGEYRNISYDPSYEKLTLNVARIHKADGRTVEIQPRQVQVRDSGTDYLVYNPDKQVIISFPSLEVGDTIEVKWTIRGRNPEHGGKFFTRYSFGDTTYPIVLDELRVRLPKSLPFKYACVRGTIEPKKTDEGDQVLHIWKAADRKQTPQGENLPPAEELRPTLCCTTFASWEEVGKWKADLRAACWECEDTVRKQVMEVTKGLKTQQEKARALTYWLRRNIRYLAAGETHHYTPHKPHVVFANRFGDCKDTSQLLAVMFREAGIQVELATLGVRDDGQVLEEVPSPWGTHAILLATIDGKEHWVDTTSSLSGWDVLPRDDRDRVCYLVDHKGTLRLKQTPPLTPQENRFEVVTEVHVGADGATRCDRTSVAYGLAARNQRDDFLETPNGERRRLVANELQDSNSRARLHYLRLDEKELRDLDKPVTVKIGFEVAGQFTGSPDREGSLSDSRVWGRLLAYNIDFDRQVAFEFYAPFESKHRYVVHLPAAYVIDSIPLDREFKSPWGTFRRTITTPAGETHSRRVEIEFHTRLEKTRVDPADFDRFREFHENVYNSYRVWLTLQPASDLADSAALEAVLAHAPDDSASAAVLAKLYVKKGRLPDARRVLRRARHFNPNESLLWELTVQAADTAAEEEIALRELVKRFPSQTKHALSLGAVLVQQGKQDQARQVLQPLTAKGTASQRASAHFHLARSFYRRDQLVDALDHLMEAAKEDPDTVHTVRGYLLKARIFEEMGKLKDAESAYEDALELDATATDALDSLVKLSLALDRKPEADRYLRRYAVAVGDDMAGLLLAADYYLRMRRYDEAFELASRARDTRFHEKAYRILGLVYFHRGDWAEAVKHLEKASADAEVYDCLLRASLARGNLADAAARIDQADRCDKPTAALKATCMLVRPLLERRQNLKKKFNGPADRVDDYLEAVDAVLCAEYARRTGDKVEVLLDRAFADTSVEVGPAFGLRGRLALEKGKLGKALADAEKAIGLSPDEANGYYVRGKVKLERNAEGALADLAKASRLTKRTDADVLHAFADALWRAGLTEEAIQALREAAKLRPGDADIAEQLRTFEKSGAAGG